MRNRANGVAVADGGEDPRRPGPAVMDIRSPERRAASFPPTRAVRHFVKDPTGRAFGYEGCRPRPPRPLGNKFPPRLPAWIRVCDRLTRLQAGQMAVGASRRAALKRSRLDRATGRRLLKIGMKRWPRPRELLLGREEHQQRGPLRPRAPLRLSIGFSPPSPETPAGVNLLPAGAFARKRPAGIRAVGW